MKFLSIIFLTLISSLFIMGASWVPAPPPTPVVAASNANDTWYVRPVGECAVNGDGLAYECATTIGGRGAFNSTDVGLNWAPVTGIDDGDTVYVCGSHNTGFLVGRAASGTANRRITIRFDCPRNAGKILQQTYFPEALQAENWVNESLGLWYLSLSSYANGPRRVWVNGVEIMRSETKAVLGQAVSLNGPVRGWWFDESSKQLYLPSSQNPTLTMTELKTLSSTNDPCTFSAICFTRKENKFFDVINPNVGGGGLGSVYILGATDIRIFGSTSVNDCKIGRSSNRGVYISDSAGNGTGVASGNIEIFNCILDPGLPESIAGYTHEWNGVSHDGIFISEGSHNNSFHDLILYDWQHTGFSIAAIRGTTTVTNNVVSNVLFECRWFVEYCRAFGIDGNRLNAATGNIIKNSRINNMTVRSQFNGNGNIAEENLFTNQRVGAVVISKKNISQVLEFQAYAGPAQDNIVRKNIFLNNTTGPCISFRASTFTNSNHTIENNTFINCGGLDTPGADYVTLHIPNELNVGNQIIRNNKFLKMDGHLPVNYKSSGFQSVIDFETSCSGDVCSNNFEIDIRGLNLINNNTSYSIGCGLGMWWQMSVNSKREYVCFQ